MKSKIGCGLIYNPRIFIYMSKKETLTDEHVMRVLKTLDDDLAVQVVLSCVSLNPNHLLKTLIMATDVSYYRNMIRDMKKSDRNSKNDLSPEDIATLLKTDGWII